MFIKKSDYDDLCTRAVELATETKELDKENKALYEENRDLRHENKELSSENKELKQMRTEPENRAMYFAKALKNIEEAISINQYGSVENLRNTIKSILEETAKSI